MTENFRKQGYEYTLLWRDSKMAIYEQKNPETGKCMYEVIKIRIREYGVANFGISAGPEGFPKSSEWGSRGWTVKSLTRAFELIQEKKNG